MTITNNVINKIEIDIKKICVPKKHGTRTTPKRKRTKKIRQYGEHTRRRRGFGYVHNTEYSSITRTKTIQ